MHERLPFTTERFEAIGTAWTIDFSLPARGTAAELVSSIHATIDTFDRTYSRFRDDSLIARMSREAGTYRLPTDAKPLLDLYEDLYEKTGGAFTPLIGQMLSDAGYDADYSFAAKQLSSLPSWDDVLTYAYPDLTLSRPAVLDFGAAGKGYLVDKVADLVHEAGVQEYIVDAGGDMRIRMLHEPVRVGLEHPEDPESVIGVAHIIEGSICGSAGNRRSWESQGTRYHHIFDPYTRSSPSAVRAVWVTASEARVADALTTCLYLLPLERMLPQLASYSFEYLVVYEDFTSDRSPGFAAEVFTDTAA